MSKRKYLELLMQMPVDWLKRSASEPSVCMSKMDILLHYVAIRRLSGEI